MTRQLGASASSQSDVKQVVIDSQIHVWESDPQRPWAPDDWSPYTKSSYTVEDALSEMDALDIDAAVLILPGDYRTELSNGSWRFDNSYAEEAATKYPGRFASMIRVDARDPDACELVRDCRNRPGVLGVRLPLGFPGEWERFESGAFDPLLKVAEDCNVPVMFALSGKLHGARAAAEKFPSLTIVIDHLGMKQPPQLTAEEEPFAALDELLTLADYPNISVKLTGLPTLSRQKLPFDDVWPVLDQILERFGPDRLLWGTDITRTKACVSWSDALEYIQSSSKLSDEHKDQILGAALLRILRWER